MSLLYVWSELSSHTTCLGKRINLICCNCSDRLWNFFCGVLAFSSLIVLTASSQVGLYQNMYQVIFWLLHLQNWAEFLMMCRANGRNLLVQQFGGVYGQYAADRYPVRRHTWPFCSNLTSEAHYRYKTTLFSSGVPGCCKWGSWWALIMKVKSFTCAASEAGNNMCRSM